MHLTNQNEYSILEGMDTLEDFEKQFGVEKQCLDYLTRLRWPNGYRCPRCHHDESWKISDKKYKCKNCGYQTTATAGTIFQDSHVPLTDWLKAAWYLTSSSGKKTAAELQKLLGLGSNRTAQLMMDKFSLVWDSCVGYQLEGTIEIQTRKILLPISKEKKSVLFIAAVELYGAKAGRVRMGIVREKFYQNENEFVRKTIAPGSKLLGVRWSNSNQLFQTGEYERTAKRPEYTFKYAVKALDDLASSIERIRAQKSTIPRYIRQYCFRKNRLLGKVEFETLLKAAIDFQPTPYGELPAKSKAK